MINQVIDLTGLIISIFGMIQVWQSRILERRSRRYFLGIFSILIAYAVSYSDELQGFLVTFRHTYDHVVDE